jgi:hypothetical protein
MEAKVDIIHRDEAFERIKRMEDEPMDERT